MAFRWLKPTSVPEPAALWDAQMMTKWLIPSAAGLFAVVGYVVRAGHSSLLGGGIVADEGAGYSGAAADFFYDLPTITADVMVSLLPSADVFSQPMVGANLLAGHAPWLLVAACLATSVWWGPYLLAGRWARRLPNPLLTRGWMLMNVVMPPVLLVMLLVGKFAWFDAPMALIQNVVIASNDAGIPSPGWKPPDSTKWIDPFLNARATALWRNMVCSRGGPASSNPNPTLVCEPGVDKDRRLVEGEFAARLLACLLVCALIWKTSRHYAGMRQLLALLALLTLFSLPYAYGKLLKPTVFEYGLVDLVKVPAGMPSEQGGTVKPLEAMVLAKRSATMDLLVQGIAQCSGTKTYKIARVWTVPNSQIVAVREIFRRDVIAWKLDQDSMCGEALPPEAGVERSN